MTEPPPRDEQSDGPAGSAPWERPRRWNQQRLDATRVDDLLARLGNDDEISGRRKRRREAAEATAQDSTDHDSAGHDATGQSTEDPENADNDHTDPDDDGNDDAGDQVAADEQRPGRRSHRADEIPATQISAADLIAALGGNLPGQPGAAADPAAAAADSDTADTTTADTTTADAPAQGPAAAESPATPSSPSVSSLPSSPGDPAEPAERSEPAEFSGPSAAAAPSDATDIIAAARPDQDPKDEPPLFGGPGVVTMPGYDDAGTDQMPLIGPQEDVNSIRESLRRQHGAVPAAAAAGAGSATGGGQRAAGRSGGHSTGHGFLWAGRAAIAAVAVVLLIFTGIEWTLIKQTNEGLTQKGGNYVQTSDSNIVTPTKSVPTHAGGEPAAAGVILYPPENILLLGSDTRAGANGNSGNSNGTTDTAQSDTLMLAHVSADRQNVTVLSIPRDLRISAPHCRIWDSNTGKLSNEEQPVTPTTHWKITNAYSVGGAACTVKAIQALTGLRIDRVIGIDFEGFKSMVDALGGVAVNVCKPIVDRELGTVVAASGEQTIHGDQALSLVRARKVVGDPTGDYGRIHRQQVVLSAMLQQVTSAGTLLNPSKLNNFLDAFVDSTFTDNVTVDSLIDLAHQLGNLQPGKVTFYTLPAHANPADNGDSQLLDQKTADAVFSALVNDERLPGETVSSSTAATSASGSAGAPKTSTSSSSAPSKTNSAAPTTHAPQTLSVDPRKIKLQIVNMTGIPGQATEASNGLNKDGFAIDPADLYKPDQTQKGITVEYTAGNRDAAVVVAVAVPGSKLSQVADTANYQVRLLLGSSYQGKLSSVSVGQTVPTRLQTTPLEQSTADSSVDNSSAGSSAGADGSGAESAGAQAAGAAGSTPRTRSTVTLNTKDLPAVNASSPTCA